MYGAALVLSLVTFVVPITLILLAVVADLLLLLWVLAEIIHDKWMPRILHPVRYAAELRSHVRTPLHPR